MYLDNHTANCRLQYVSGFIIYYINILSMKKTEKINKCREILHKYPICSKISDFDELKFLQSIFEGHSEWNLKKGVGIDFITVEFTAYKNKCFFIHRIDKSKTDISFMHSITNRSDISKIKLACRNSIREIIVKFRSENVIFGKTKCPITGEILTNQNTHIDHYELTFNDLFNKWIENKNIDLLVKNLNETEDNNLETYFTDNQISIDFINYHNPNTHLRAVSKQANLSILNNR